MTFPDNVVVRGDLLRSHLADTGWTDLGPDERGMRVYSRDDERVPDGSVIVALSADGAAPTTADLEAVAFVEHRDITELTSDLLFGGADMVAARLLPAMPSGQAPLLLVEQAVLSIHALLEGASFGVDDDTIIPPSRRPARQQQWLRRVRVAAQPGSFILNVACPLGEAPSISDAEEPLFSAPDPDPYGRRVVDFLHETVEQAVRTVEQHVATPATELPDLAGVNVVILEALSDLGGPDHTPYDLRFAWSPRIPHPAPADVMSVNPEVQRVFRQVAEVLRVPRERKGVRVTGAVVHLHRDRLFGPGDVVVAGTLSDETTGQIRRVTVNLAEEDYLEALAAHSAGRTVAVVGDIVRNGTRLSLRAPTGFVASHDLFGPESETGATD